MDSSLSIRLVVGLPEAFWKCSHLFVCNRQLSKTALWATQSAADRVRLFHISLNFTFFQVPGFVFEAQVLQHYSTSFQDTILYFLKAVNSITRWFAVYCCSYLKSSCNVHRQSHIIHFIRGGCGKSVPPICHCLYAASQPDSRSVPVCHSESTSHSSSCIKCCWKNGD